MRSMMSRWNGFGRELIKRQLREVDAARLLGGGLELLTSSGRHHELLDQALQWVAGWLPSRRDMVQSFIERSLERMLKWGRRPHPIVQPSNVRRSSARRAHRCPRGRQRTIRSIPCVPTSRTGSTSGYFGFVRTPR